MVCGQGLLIKQGLPAEAARRWAAGAWLFNPLAINLSTRGSADSTVVMLVLGAVSAGKSSRCFRIDQSGVSLHSSRLGRSQSDVSLSVHRGRRPWPRDPHENLPGDLYACHRAAHFWRTWQTSVQHIAPALLGAVLHISDGSHRAPGAFLCSFHTPPDAQTTAACFSMVSMWCWQTYGDEFLEVRAQSVAVTSPSARSKRVPACPPSNTERHLVPPHAHGSPSQLLDALSVGLSHVGGMCAAAGQCADEMRVPP